jgi:hypothetical protein
MSNARFQVRKTAPFIVGGFFTHRHQVIDTHNSDKLIGQYKRENFARNKAFNLNYTLDPAYKAAFQASINRSVQVQS